jgi:hypothetical protein
LPDPEGHGADKLKERRGAFWMESIEADYVGKNPLDDDYPEYLVWRNVKDYGTVSDGVIDDTDAITMPFQMVIAVVNVVEQLYSKVQPSISHPGRPCQRTNHRISKHSAQRSMV